MDSETVPILEKREENAEISAPANASSDAVYELKIQRDTLFEEGKKAENEVIDINTKARQAEFDEPKQPSMSIASDAQGSVVLESYVVD